MNKREREVLKKSNDRMRRASGRVADGSLVVAFLYSLMRDHLTPGNVEKIMLQLECGATSIDYVFTNGWLAKHAQDIAYRLNAECEMGDDDSDG